MLPSMPIISFGRQGGQFEQVRRQEPTLFLSMIAAAASTLTVPDMFEKLQKEAVSIITYNAVVEGQKTSELLLSLLVLTFWPMAPSRYPSPPPPSKDDGNSDRFDQLKTYLHCHMCVGMAIDLSLQRGAKDGRNLSSRLFAEEVEPCNRKENFIRPLEKERTWLAVFIAAIGYPPPQTKTVAYRVRFAVGMRRPQTLDWSPHHSYCCQALIEGGQAGDIRLVQICQLIKLSQDVSRTFCYDTRPKSPPSPPPYKFVFSCILTCGCRVIRPLSLSHRK